MTVKRSILAIALSITVLATGCSTSKSNSIMEYGYNGTVKSIVSKSYADLEEKNGEWILDDSKITSISTVTFNETGNIIRSVKKFPNEDIPKETLIYLYTDDNLKSSLISLTADGDTLFTGFYRWKDDLNYVLDISIDGGHQLLSTSKLNENYRDLSGNSTYYRSDTIWFSNSYKNEIDDRNLLIRTVNSPNRIVQLFKTNRTKKSSHFHNENNCSI